MSESVKRCETCIFFEPSPIGQRGECQELRALTSADCPACWRWQEREEEIPAENKGAKGGENGQG